jgi:hypothetical protein
VRQIIASMKVKNYFRMMIDKQCIPCYSNQIVRQIQLNSQNNGHFKKRIFEIPHVLIENTWLLSSYMYTTMHHRAVFAWNLWKKDIPFHRAFRLYQDADRPTWCPRTFGAAG